MEPELDPFFFLILQKALKLVYDEALRVEDETSANLLIDQIALLEVAKVLKSKNAVVSVVTPALMMILDNSAYNFLLTQLTAKSSSYIDLLKDKAKDLLSKGD